MDETKVIELSDDVKKKEKKLPVEEERERFRWAAEDN